MTSFLQQCTGCHIDGVAMHWYDAAWNTGYFTNYFTDAYASFKKPLWITEVRFYIVDTLPSSIRWHSLGLADLCLFVQFAGAGSVAEQQTFLKTVLPWMEQQSFIERYAAFGTSTRLAFLRSLQDSFSFTRDTTH